MANQPSTTADRSLLIKNKPINTEFWLVGLLAFIIRLAWALASPSVDPFLNKTPLLGDAATYDFIVLNLLDGKGYTTHPPEPGSFWPPLYPLFLSAVYSLVGHHLQIARLVQALIGVIVPLAMYLLAIHHLGQGEARLVGIGLAFYPFLVYFGAWLIAEALFMALLALVLWSASRLVDTWRFRTIILIGFLSGLAALAKPTMLFIIPFIGGWLFFAPQQWPFRKRISILFALAFSTLVTILPWTIRNYIVENQLVLISSNGGYTFLGANNPNAWGGHDEYYPPLIPGLNEAEMSNQFYREAWQWIRSNPTAFLELLPKKYARLFSPLSIASQRQDFQLPGAPLIYSIYWIFLALALLGMGMAFRRWRQIGYLYAPVLGVLVSTGVFYGDTRYTLPMAPSLVIFASIAMTCLFSYLKPSTHLTGGNH